MKFFVIVIVILLLLWYGRYLNLGQSVVHEFPVQATGERSGSGRPLAETGLKLIDDAAVINKKAQVNQIFHEMDHEVRILRRCSHESGECIAHIER